MVQKGIFCLEGLWDDDLKRKSSVRPILTMLEINSGVEFIHQDVATVEELEFYLGQWKRSRYRGYPILYLAFHGVPAALLIGEQQYTLDYLAEFLADACDNSIVLLASCSTLRTDRRNIKRFLRRTNALALCGYRGKVSWMVAAAFEILILSAFQEIDFSGKGLAALERRIGMFGDHFGELDFSVVTRRELVAAGIELATTGPATRSKPVRKKRKSARIR